MATIPTKTYSLVFRCEAIKGKDLNPGDVFSKKGEEYWCRERDFSSIAEMAWIRMATPSKNAPDAQEVVYRLKWEVHTT